MRKHLDSGLIFILCLALALSLAACQKKDSPSQKSPAEVPIFNTGNSEAVNSQPINPVVFTIDQSYKITYISDYHYLNQDAPPGTIALQSQDGIIYGPWPATGVPSQDNVPNASWIVRPEVVIKPGTYTVVDSDPATWSQNNKSGNRGFTDVRGYKSE